ncbi:MAG: retropepsin-like domain-containing protein [Candidatus Eremiobacteraeota bacterium]|nr:retropepsin-like domain-containing protein [Candidatus Eremiobacteraeota bacterium]
MLRISALTSGQWRLTNAFAGEELSGAANGFGLLGRYREVDDFRTGRFAWRADYGAWPLAEGLDRRGRWRMDASRRVHFLNSNQATAVAVTEAYIASRGYARLGNRNATSIGSSYESDQRCDLIAVTPSKGVTAVLSIGRRDRLLHRIDVHLSTRIETIRYGNYRSVRGAKLPFSVSVDDGDAPATAHITISSYRFLARVDAAAFEPPPQSLDDARINNGATARVPLTISRGTGFPIVFAAINGYPAMPFIVDTGGHDILTPSAARYLRLKVTGRGVSFGSGPGSTPTALTSVQNVSIGNAAMLSQPFTVLDLDLGKASDARGQLVPIAGILGLEFFERFKVTLNFPKREVGLALQADADSGDKWIPLTFTSDEPLVDARLNGRLGSFAIDTGNNVGLIVYHRWLLATSTSAPGLNWQPGEMGGSSVGGAVMFRHARADSFVLGAMRLNGVPLLVANAHAGSMSSTSEAGSLGVPPLLPFCVTFDYRAGTMAIRR